MYKATCFDLIVGYLQAYLRLCQVNATPVGALSCYAVVPYCFTSVAEPGVLCVTMELLQLVAYKFSNRGFSSGHPLSESDCFVAFGVLFLGRPVWCVAGGGFLGCTLRRVLFVLCW
jgi:hypothetical protein